MTGPPEPTLKALITSAVEDCINLAHEVRAAAPLRANDPFSLGFRDAVAKVILALGVYKEGIVDFEKARAEYAPFVNRGSGPH
jgi:hypothetical protein